MQLPRELTTVTPLSKILALILFFLLPIIGFLFGMQYESSKDLYESVEMNEQGNYNMKPTVSVNQTTTFKSLDIPVINTNGWLTYTSKYGYTIKYPRDWIIYSNDWYEGNIAFGPPDKDTEIVLRHRDSHDMNSHGGPPIGGSINLALPEDNPQNLTSYEWAMKRRSTQIPVDIDNISINGQEAAQMDAHGLGIIVYISRGSKMYKFANSSVGIETKGGYDYDYKEIFYQILSTLNFTN